MLLHLLIEYLALISSAQLRQRLSARGINTRFCGWVLLCVHSTPKVTVSSAETYERSQGIAEGRRCTLSPTAAVSSVLAEFHEY